MKFLSIVWDPSLGIDLGFFVVRWYSLMFVIAFILGLRLMKKIFIEDKVPVEKLDALFIYTFISMLVGMRLGDVFFYSWDYYQHHLLEIVLPFKENPNSSAIKTCKGKSIPSISPKVPNSTPLISITLF